MASKVEVKVSIDGGEFQTGLLRIKQSAMNFKSDLIAQFTGFSLANLFMTGIAAAIDFLGELAEEMGRIKDKAEQFGVSMREWQIILNGVRNNGGGDENVIAFFDSMTKARQEAINGNEKYQKSFRDLGISIDDLKSKSNDELFYAIADGVKVADDAQKAYYDTMVIGRGGAKELFNALALGSDVLRQEGESLGVYSDSMINVIDTGAKQWEWLWSHIKTWCAWGFSFLGTTLWTFYDLFRLSFHGIWDTIQIVVLPIVDIFKSLWNTVMGVVYSVMALGAALSGNLSTAKDYAQQSADSFKKAWKNATTEVASDVKGVLDNSYNRMANDFDKNYQARDKILSDLFGTGDDSPEKATDDSQIRGYTDYAKIEELQAKLDAEREKYAFEQLDSLGKIKNLEEKIAELKKDANEETEKGLNASLKVLELEKQVAQEKAKITEKEKKELADLENRKKQLADTERQQAFDQLSTLDKIISLEAQIAEEKRKANRETKEGIEHSMKVVSLQKQLANENKKLDRQREQANKAEQDYLFSKMSKEEQIKVLQARAVELRAKANDATEEGLQAKVDFYANQKQLDSLLENKKRGGNTPQVIASSLAAIGGGGNVYAPSFSVAEKQLDESKKQTKNLERIAESTEVIASREAKGDELLMR